MEKEERKRELEKRESLKERERKIYRELERIDFRLSLLPKIMEKVRRNCIDHDNIGNRKLLLAQRSLSSCEHEALKEMKDELNKELKEVQKKIKT